MILINLLPHRAEKRRRRKQAFFAGLGLSGVAGALVAALWTMGLWKLTEQQQERNKYLEAETSKLDEQIRDIASLKKEIDGLKARQKVVIDFQIDRNMPVHLLNELVHQTPEGVYLSTLKQDGTKVVITGMAQSNERVSELLRKVANDSPWIEHPELAETKATLVATSTREQKRLYEFSMKFGLKRPVEKPSIVAGRPAMSGSSSAAPIVK
jgi:type IV pilus assembly protein PilN